MPRWDFERRRELGFGGLHTCATVLRQHIDTYGDDYGAQHYSVLRNALTSQVGYEFGPTDQAYENVFRNYERLFAGFAIATAKGGRLRLLRTGLWLIERQPNEQQFYWHIVDTFRYPNPVFASHQTWVDTGRQLSPFKLVLRAMAALAESGADGQLTPLEILTVLYHAHDDIPGDVLAEAVVRLRQGKQGMAPLLQTSPAMIAGEPDRRQTREVLAFLRAGGLIRGGPHNIQMGARYSLTDAGAAALAPTTADVVDEAEDQDADNSGRFVLIEGDIHQETRRTRRRNPKLRRLALDHYELRCPVCKDDYSRLGDRGSSVVDVHHLNPLASADSPREITVDDVRVVCATCHRLVHTEDPPLTPEEAAEIAG
ncbi:MAG TPA: hypothetical protein QGH10_03445 [Armatimonadota bacterium]|nr:hypothetical protein [Armatimonadota bacterium]